mgnify:CR=1 FL=1
MPDFPKKSGGLNFGKKSSGFGQPGFSGHSGVQPGPMSGMPYASPNKNWFSKIKGLFGGGGDSGSGISEETSHHFKTKDNIQDEQKVHGQQGTTSRGTETYGSAWERMDPKKQKEYGSQEAFEKSASDWWKSSAGQEKARTNPEKWGKYITKDEPIKIEKIGLKPLETKEPEVKLAKADMSQMPEAEAPEKKKSWFGRTWDKYKAYRQTDAAKNFSQSMMALGGAVGSKNMGQTLFENMSHIQKLRTMEDAEKRKEELLAKQETRSQEQHTMKQELHKLETDPDRLALADETTRLSNLRRQQLIDAHDKKLELEGSDPFSTTHT